MRFTLKKTERLHKKKLIEELFSKGSYFYFPPFKILYLQSDERDNQILIAVPKKRFRKAVMRNRVKRRVREAYRLSQHNLTQRGLLLAFIVISSEDISFENIHNSVRGVLSKLNKKITQ